MSRLRRRNGTGRGLLAAWLLAGGALGACGRVGTLEQPAPLYGAKAKADYEAKKAAAVKAPKGDTAPEPLPSSAPR